MKTTKLIIALLLLTMTGFGQLVTPNGTSYYKTCYSQSAVNAGVKLTIPRHTFDSLLLIYPSVRWICDTTFGTNSGWYNISVPLTYLVPDYLQDTLTGHLSGIYYIEMTGQNGYFMQDTVIFQKNLNIQNICMVTVDSTSTKNVLIWSKPVTTGIDSFKIYREVSSSYIKVASLPYSHINTYTDTSAGVNPNLTAYKYKMTTIDNTCENESPLSTLHRTIHLSVSPNSPQGYNLSWNDYVGFNVATYLIFRDTSGTGNDLVKFDSVSFGNTSYTDISANLPLHTRYLVEVAAPSGGCAISMKNPQPMNSNLNSSRSNIYKVSNTSTVNEISLNDLINIYPNPTSGIFSVTTGSSSQYNIEIYNVFGEKVYSSIINNRSPIISLDAPNGIYFLQLKTSVGIANKKIIIQK